MTAKHVQPTPRVCPECGVTFFTARAQKNFCTPEHRDEYRRRMRRCLEGTDRRVAHNSSAHAIMKVEREAARRKEYIAILTARGEYVSPLSPTWTLKIRIERDPLTHRLHNEAKPEADHDRQLELI